MKKIGALNVGLAFAGCFLGAGYVSGQELWQFFGAFGKNGVLGLIIAMAILCLVGIMMIQLNRITHIAEIDKLVVRGNSPVLRAAVTVLELLFLFGVVSIMSAGVGALLEQLFELPAWIGSAVFAALVAAVSLAGLGGMVKAFSATVPALAIATFIFGILSVSNGGIQILPAEQANPLMGSWFIAALSFAAYNLFGSIAMVAPLGEFTKSKRAAIGGIMLGTAILFIIAGSVLLSVSANPDTVSAELPMLALALGMGKATGYIYGALLLLAMFGTALSSLVGFVNLLSHKSERIKKGRLWFTVLTVSCAFCGSLFGFGDLIGILYPLFGYCSSVFIVLMAVHYFKVRKEKAKNEQITDKA